MNFKPGDRIRIQLTNRESLYNGKTGTIEEDHVSEQKVVAIDGAGTGFIVHISNLRPLKEIKNLNDYLNTIL